MILLSKLGKTGESYCIGGNEERSNNEVVNHICQILDKEFPENRPHIKLINYVEDRPGHDHRYSIDFSKIKTNCGWEPKYSFSEGLSKTVDWFIKNIHWMEKVQKEY